MNNASTEIQLKTTSSAYFWQNLARKSWVRLMGHVDNERLQCIERSVRFEVYKEFDEDVTETALRLSETFRKENPNCKRDLTEFYPEAAALVYSEWKSI